MKNIIVFLAVFLSLGLKAQVDSVQVVDTVKQHSVRKALLFSAVVPGSGQIYNHLAMPKGQKKAFWKVPLIYSGLGAFGYFTYKNNSLQKQLKQIYINRTVNGDYTDDYFAYDNQGILTLYNQHLNRRDLNILGFIVVYALQVADAGIEAHFVNFDVSQDLSMRFSPTILPSNQLGISLSFNFR